MKILLIIMKRKIKIRGQMMKNKKGFTLIELLAVIVILAIIMVIATMQVNKTIKKARQENFDNVFIEKTDNNWIIPKENNK